MKKNINKKMQLEKKYIIFCEDKKSSKIYLEELRKIYNASRRFDIKHVKTDGDYINMVESIKKDIKNNKYISSLIEKIFFVVDLDVSKQNETQNNNFQKMQKFAKENDINIIICDPNFELYLLLHFEKCCPFNNKEINRKLIKYIKEEYKKEIDNIDNIKNNLQIFKKICENENVIKKAIINNKELYNSKDNQTTFYEIVELIIK